MQQLTAFHLETAMSCSAVDDMTKPYEELPNRRFVSMPGPHQRVLFDPQNVIDSSKPRRPVEHVLDDLDLRPPILRAARNFLAGLGRHDEPWLTRGNSTGNRWTDNKCIVARDICEQHPLFQCFREENRRVAVLFGA
jgi:hypothetical protein